MDRSVGFDNSNQTLRRWHWLLKSYSCPKSALRASGKFTQTPFLAIATVPDLLVEI
jgi:hypothetical protein